MKLSIVIVNWNVRDLIRACLRSIDEHKGELDVEVIVVDSASADDSVALIAAEFPHVHLLAQSENVGLPRGNNIGIAHATGDYVLLLNPDTEIVGDALQQMIAYMEANPAVGLLGSQLLNPDGSHQSSRRRFPTVWTGIFESTWLQPLSPKSILRRYYVLDANDSQTVPVDWVSGAAMLTRHNVIEQVGGMDEAYFMYSEELDWCRRIKDVGWEIVYFADAKIVHHVGKSSEQAVTRRHINFNRAKLRYFRKFHGRGAYRVVRAVLLANYVAQIKIEGLKWLLGHRRELRRQRISAYWQVLQSRLSAAGF